jgi:hypothetical protein
MNKISGISPLGHDISPNTCGIYAKVDGAKSLITFILPADAGPQEMEQWLNFLKSSDELKTRLRVKGTKARFEFKSII